MTFIIILIGAVLTGFDLFVFPDLFHYSILLDLSMIWILFSWDIQEEESIYTFLTIIMIKTLFMPHSTIVFYILSMGILYSLYYFLLPLFFQRESWLSFLLCFLSSLILPRFLYQVNGKILFLSLLVQTLFYFLLFVLRKALQRSNKKIQNSFSVSV